MHTPSLCLQGAEFKIKQDVGAQEAEADAGPIDHGQGYVQAVTERWDTDSP